MLQAKNVTKAFGELKALDGATLTVPKGAVYGLVGPNGAGKSTIIRHFTGVYRPDMGKVLLDGEPVFENTAAKQRMCVIPDDWYYYPQANVKEMAGLYRAMYPSFSDERYEKLKEVFSFGEKTSFRRMSKGMRKQAAFWLSLSACPEVLILDEPVDGLDPVMRRQIWSILLGDVAERETTVLISSHNLRELEDVCDYVGIMNRGKILLERSLGDLQENTLKIQAVFDGEEPDFTGTLDIINRSSVGRVVTYIVRGSYDEVSGAFAARSPLLFESVPMTLEEIFIYELGGENYVVKNIAL